jgi:hypothetical protein
MGYRLPVSQAMDLARSHGPTGFGVEDGRRKGPSGAVARAFGGRAAVLDYAARLT